MGSLMRRMSQPQGVVGVQHRMVGVGQQIVTQAALLLPFRQGRFLVGADAQHDRVPRLICGRTSRKPQNLVVAVMRVGFREGEDNHAPPTQIAEANRPPILIAQREVGGGAFLLLALMLLLLR